MIPTHILTKGEPVRVRAADDDEWVNAVVIIASPNGQSVALALDGMVRAGGGFAAGVLPLSIDYEQETVTSLMGHQYEIETL